MRIAVNARFLLTENLEGYGYFVAEVFRRLAVAHPEHHFIFLFDRPADPRFQFAENISLVVTGPPARHPLLWKIWFDWKVPAVLRRHKADIFISCDGFCSLTTRVPQYLVLHDLAFLHYPGFIKRAHLFFYKYYTPKFLRKARQVATVSVFSKKDIIAAYHVDEEKISVVYSGVKEIFKPIDALKAAEIKSRYTGGHEYFIYTGSIHPRKNLIQLLKAFSVFKKRQKSDWKLVLAGRLAWKYDSFMKSLSSYRHRNDVILTGYLEEHELAGLTAAAYALIYPSLWEGFGVPPLEAMQCGVPVITSADSAMSEIAGAAALYADPADHQDIAEKMMLLYKDESLRNKLIEAGHNIVKKYSWDRTADLIWDSWFSQSAQRI